VIRANRLPTPLVWIEHWPTESTDDGAETFDLVVFTSYEVTERAPYLGETRAWIGEATWNGLDRTIAVCNGIEPSSLSRGSEGTVIVHHYVAHPRARPMLGGVGQLH
jgi:hypothetical protein